MIDVRKGVLEPAHRYIDERWRHAGPAAGGPLARG